MAGDEQLTPIRLTPPPHLYLGRCFLCRWYRDPDKMEINRNDRTPTQQKSQKRLILIDRLLIFE
jgi:hypothetical protein